MNLKPSTIALINWTLKQHKSALLARIAAGDNADTHHVTDRQRTARLQLVLDGKITVKDGHLFLA